MSRGLPIEPADFLRAIFDGTVTGERRITIFTVPQHKTWRFDAIERAVRYCERRSAVQNVYFGLSLIAGKPKGRGRFEDAAAIGALWADIDVAGEAHSRGRLPGSIEEAFELLRTLPLPPSVVVHSGHGLHAYWLLKEPWVFETGQDRRYAARLAKGWHGLVCDVARRRGWALENLGDLTRVLRLPGTLNLKNPEKPVAVRVVEWHPDRRYEPLDFEQYIAGPDDGDPQYAVDVVLRADAEPPADKLAELLGKSGKFRLAWEHNRSDLPDSSQSGYDLSLASIAARHGWSDQEIADLLIAARRRSCGDPGKALRQDYIRRTIERARSQSDGDEAKSGKKRKRRKADVALELILNRCRPELWHDREPKAYATVERDGRYETYPVRSRRFRLWVAGMVYKLAGVSLGDEHLRDVCGTLESVALFEGPQQDAHVRVAQHDGDIWLDLADERWRAVHVTPDGWSAVNKPPVRFIRPRGVLALPEPRRCDDPQAVLAELRDLANLTHDADGWALTLAWLVAALRPAGPYPVMVLTGEQGSAKSTTARMLRALVDPNMATLRSEPHDARDLMIAATNAWVVGLDNLSRVQPWLSDALCRLATGGGFATRELYTDADETLFDAQRPVILNGITNVATRSDLLDRALVVHLPPIPDDRRLPERELRRRFERLRPAVLGLLLDTVARGLRDIEAVRLPALPRMADFAEWAAASLPALDIEADRFLAAYRGNVAGSNASALEASAVADPLIRLVEAIGCWQGTAAELLAALDDQADDRARRSPGWPKTPQGMRSAIDRIAPNLRRLGITIERHKETAGRRRRLLTIRKTEAQSSPDRPQSSPIVRRKSPLTACKRGLGTMGTMGTILPPYFGALKLRPDWTDDATW